MVMGENICSYAQFYEGDVYEFRGSMKGTSSKVYTYEKLKSAHAVVRINEGEVVPNVPKLVTPIAAVAYAPD